MGAPDPASTLASHARRLSATRIVDLLAADPARVSGLSLRVGPIHASFARQRYDRVVTGEGEPAVDLPHHPASLLDRRGVQSPCRQVCGGTHTLDPLSERCCLVTPGHGSPARSFVRHQLGVHNLRARGGVHGCQLHPRGFREARGELGLVGPASIG